MDQSLVKEILNELNKLNKKFETNTSRLNEQRGQDYPNNPQASQSTLRPTSSANLQPFLPLPAQTDSPSPSDSSLTSPSLSDKELPDAALITDKQLLQSTLNAAHEIIGKLTPYSSLTDSSLPHHDSSHASSIISDSSPTHDKLVPHSLYTSPNNPPSSLKKQRKAPNTSKKKKLPPKLRGKLFFSEVSPKTSSTPPSVLETTPNYGVTFVTVGKKTYWECFWISKQGKKNSKRFSCKRFGGDTARDMALELLHKRMSPQDYHMPQDTPYLVPTVSIKPPNKKVNIDHPIPKGEHYKLHNRQIADKPWNGKGATKIPGMSSPPTEPSLVQKPVDEDPLLPYIDPTHTKKGLKASSHVQFPERPNRKEPSSKEVKNKVKRELPLKKPKKRKATENLETNKLKSRKRLANIENQPSPQDSNSHTAIQSSYPSQPDPDTLVNGCVYLDKTSHTLSFMEMGRWIATWVVNGRCLQRSFSISQFGYEQAQKMALNFRKNKVETLLQSLTNIVPISTQDIYHKRTEARPITSTHRKRGRPRKSTPEKPTISSNDIVKKPSFPPQNKSFEQIDRPEGHGEIFWDDSTKSWCVELPTSRNSTFLERISAKAHGYEKARRVARQKLEESEQSLLHQYYDGSTHGIAYERSRHCWRVTFWIESKQVRRNKYFNISKYGWEKAKQLAIIYREKVDELRGEEPPDWGSGPKLTIQESPLLRKILEKDHPYKMKYKTCSGMINEISNEYKGSKKSGSKLITKSNKTAEQNLHQNKMKRPYRKQHNPSQNATSTNSAYRHSDSTKMISEGTSNTWKRKANHTNPTPNTTIVYNNKRERSSSRKRPKTDPEDSTSHDFGESKIQTGYSGSESVEQGEIQSAEEVHDSTPPLSENMTTQNNKNDFWDVYWIKDDTYQPKPFNMGGSNENNALDQANKNKKIFEIKQQNKVSRTKLSSTREPEKSEEDLAHPSETSLQSRLWISETQSNDSYKQHSSISFEQDDDISSIDMCMNSSNELEIASSPVSNPNLTSVKPSPHQIKSTNHKLTKCKKPIDNQSHTLSSKQVSNTPYTHLSEIEAPVNMNTQNNDPLVLENSWNSSERSHARYFSSPHYESADSSNNEKIDFSPDFFVNCLQSKDDTAPLDLYIYSSPDICANSNSKFDQKLTDNNTRPSYDQPEKFKGHSKNRKCHFEVTLDTSEQLKLPLNNINKPEDTNLDQKIDFPSNSSTSSLLNHEHNLTEKNTYKRITIT